MCLNQTYGKLNIGKCFYNKFYIENGLKQEDSLPLMSASSSPNNMSSGRSTKTKRGGIEWVASSSGLC